MNSNVSICDTIAWKLWHYPQLYVDFQVDTSNILDCNEGRAFWVAWSNGDIRIGIILLLTVTQ